MSVEAEIKARVTDPERPNAALSRRATGERSTYHDRTSTTRTDGGPPTVTNCGCVLSPRKMARAGCC